MMLLYSSHLLPKIVKDGGLADSCVAQISSKETSTGRLK